MASDKFFSDDYLDQLIPQKQAEQGPVTVFGLTFKNDEERRQYFREELRRRLPELRKIEGFPIGEDDDIINLSDPPYYTACPNPWLNDFIAQWEEEKKELQREGKRKADFEVKEPYANDVSEGKNNPVYTAHPYHTKVPHPAIMRYILHYTQPGDIVFDGFAGTGMTGVAASTCANATDEIAMRINDEWLSLYGSKPRWGKRHAICGDLSPYASHISHFYNMPIDGMKLRKEIVKIQKELEEECGWMYTTTNSQGNPTGKINFVLWSDVMVCPSCGKEYVYWKYGVKMQDGRVTSLDTYPCPYCGAQQSRKIAKPAIETYYDDGTNTVLKRVKQVPVIIVGKDGKEKIQREPNSYDIELLAKIEKTKIDNWFPIFNLPEGLKTRDPKAREVYYAHQFYTKRTLIALAKLYAKIESSPMSFALRFMFTSMLNLISKRNRVQAKNPYSRGQGVLNLTLVLPPFPTEASLLEMLEMRLNSILKAKDAIPNKYVSAQYVASADNLTVKGNSIDYIFTDPPFGANINYSELNSMPEPWLKVVTNNSHEAIVNEAQGKNEVTYRDTMARCFKEYYRILKPGKWMTVEFSNTSASVWNSIQNSLQQSGFVIANVSALDKKQGGMNANMTTTAVKQDLAISCYKPSENIQDNANQGLLNVWDFVEEHLNHLAVFQIKNGKMMSLPERDQRILYDRLISYYVQNGLQVPISSRDFQIGLHERFVERDGMYFTALQAAEYEHKKITTPEFVPMGIMVSDEVNGIEWIKNQLRQKPQTYQDIYPNFIKALNGIRKGDQIPGLDVLLEENFIQNEDGTWRLANVNDDVDLEKLRTKALLKEFKLYLEVCRKPRGKLKDVRVEAVRAGFKQCYSDKNFADIILVGDRIPQNLLTEDEVLLQYYDIASSKV